MLVHRLLVNEAAIVVLRMRIAREISTASCLPVFERCIKHFCIAFHAHAAGKSDILAK